MTETMASQVKLNFLIPEDLEDGLNEYCDSTGRSHADLLRQLLSEFIDGDRKLTTPARECLGGVRSNMIIPSKLLESLDHKILIESHSSRGGVITRLLYDFLEGKLGNLDEKVEVALKRVLYTKLMAKGKNKKTIETLVLEACEKYVGE